MTPDKAAMARRYLAVVLVGVAGIAMASMKAIVIGTYVSDFGQSAAFAGYILSSEMVAATGGVILATIFPNIRWLWLACVAIFVGNMGTAFLAHGETIFFWQVIAGLGHGFAIGRLAGGVATVRNPQRLSGIYGASYLVLSSLCAISLPNLRHLIGNHALFIMLAMTGPLAMLGLRYFPPVGKGHHHASATETPVVGRPLVILIGVTQLLWYISIGGYFPFMGQLGAQAGISFNDWSRILGAGQLFGLLGVSLSIVIGDRFKSFVPLVFLITAQCVAVMTFIILNNPLAFTISAWLYVFAWLGGFPFQLGLMSKIDPTGRLNALAQVMGNAAYAIGPAGAGLIIRSASSEGLGLRHVQHAGFGLLLLSGSVMLALAAHFSGRSAKAAPT